MPTGEIHLQSRGEGRVGRREGGGGLLALVSPSTNLPLDVISYEANITKPFYDYTKCPKVSSLLFRDVLS